MPRPKDDADKLHRNRNERRELIDQIAEAPADDFEELSEVTRPNIQIVMTPPLGVQTPPAELPAPRPPQPSGSTIQELSGTLDKLPSNHRIYAFIALVLAVLGAYIAKMLLG